MSPPSCIGKRNNPIERRTKILTSVASSLVAALLIASAPRALEVQTYATPTNGDYDGTGPFAVSINSFTNPPAQFWRVAAP
jgi:hypothetical protein